MPLKTVIIGALGHISYAFNTLTEKRKAVLCGIASGTPGDLPDDTASEIIRQLPCPRFASWEKMLDEINPDLAIIGTRFDRNGIISLECLKRGIHCFTEKSIAHNFEQLEAMINITDTKPVKIFGMHEMRYEPQFRAVHDAIKNNAIGTPKFFFGQKSYCFGNLRPDFYKHRDTYGGTILWVGIHAIDLSYWLLGAWQKVSAIHSCSANHNYEECESHCTIQIDFGDGAIGSINADFLLPQKFGSHGDDQLRISGENGIIFVRDGKTFLATHEKPTCELPLATQKDIFNDICDEITGTGKCLLSMGDTFAVTHLALSARQAADTGTAIML